MGLRRASPGKYPGKGQGKVRGRSGEGSEEKATGRTGKHTGYAGQKRQPERPGVTATL